MDGGSTGSGVVYPPIQCLSYDGEGSRSSWRTFALKFSLVANHMKLTDDEKKEQMLFCLRGKAADYFALLWSMYPTFDKIIIEMELRFSDCFVSNINEIESQNAVPIRPVQDFDRITDHLKLFSCDDVKRLNCSTETLDSKKSSSVYSDSKLDSLVKDLENLMEKMSPKNLNVRGCSGNPRNLSRQSSVVCYGCKQRGHFVKHCMVTKLHRKLFPKKCDKWMDAWTISEAQARRIDCGV